MIAEHKEEPEPLELGKTDVKKVFENSGVPAENMELFEQNYDAAAGEKNSLMAENITETRKFNIETPDVVIKVNPDRADLVETRVIDGRQCLVIAVDDHIEVNGINVRTIKRPQSTAEAGSVGNAEGAEYMESLKPPVEDGGFAGSTGDEAGGNSDSIEEMEYTEAES